jgi:hypothetical protein
MAQRYGSYYVSSNNFLNSYEVKPFLRLNDSEGFRLALEYVVWRMYPDQADQAAIKNVVMNYVFEDTGEGTWAREAEPGKEDAFWMDLINGDRLARPWGSFDWE